MHDAASRFFRNQLRPLPPLRVVEFGSLNINGTVRDLYPQAKTWLGLDLHPGSGVDLVQDAATWDTDERFDICVSASAFEHTPDWRDILATAWQVLEPRGLLLVSCARDSHPPHSAVDGGPLRAGEWYANVNAAEMTEALADWDDVSVLEADGYYGGDDLYVRAVAP